MTMVGVNQKQTGENTKKTHWAKTLFLQDFLFQLENLYLSGLF